ncbi:DUF4167 domain-containing protein [Roseicitreum antarcticum]|nr:DUF4167 domain-containing protein [Roseicitreum antarcticum]
MRSSKQRSRSKQNRPRPVGNIINRVFDSSGPDGKVRGTPQQIIEKYQILARDAQLSNDRVAAENFLQHAEHYTRMLAEATREMNAEAEARRIAQEAQNQREQQQREQQQREQQQQRDRQAAEAQAREGQGRDGQNRDNQNRDGQNRDNQSRDNQSRDRQNNQGNAPRADTRPDAEPRQRDDRRDNRQGAPYGDMEQAADNSARDRTAVDGEDPRGVDAAQGGESTLVKTPENLDASDQPPARNVRKRAPRAPKAADGTPGSDAAAAKADAPKEPKHVATGEKPAPRKRAPRKPKVVDADSTSDARSDQSSAAE